MTALGNHGLAHRVSSSYDAVRVVGVGGCEVTRARAVLFEAARQVLYNGMCLLGFTPVERYACRSAWGFYADNIECDVQRLVS